MQKKTIKNHFFIANVKPKICIGITKIKKLKSVFLEIQILALGGRFVVSRAAVFLLRLKMNMFFAKLTAKTLIKNHSQGMHEEVWHKCHLK